MLTVADRGAIEALRQTGLQRQGKLITCRASDVLIALSAIPETVAGRAGTMARLL